MGWWLVTPDSRAPANPRHTQWIVPMWLSDAGLAVKEPAWDADPSVGPRTKQPIESIAIDPGGMISQDSHRFERGGFHGTTIYVYAVHVEHSLRWLEQLPARPSGLYNLSSYPALLVLTAQEREDAIAWLRSLLPTAMAMADVDNQAFNDRFVNARMKHVVVAPRPVRRIDNE